MSKELADIHVPPTTEPPPARNLVKTAAGGDVGELGILLQAQVSKTDKCSALIAASRNGKLRATQALIDAKADPETRNEDGFTPLMLSAMSGHTACVSALIAAKCNVDACVSKGNVPVISLAAAHGRGEVVATLISARANCNQRCDGGLIALHYAASKGWVHVIELLPIYQRQDAVDDMTATGYNALMIAASAGHASAVRWLLLHNSNPNAVSTCGSTALLLAAQNGHSLCITLLLAGNADLECRKGEDGPTPAFIAAHNGHTEALKVLMESKANMSTRCNGKTPMYAAACHGQLQALEWMISQNVPLNEPSVFGCTPVFGCVYHSQLKTLQLLLEHDADVDIGNDAGYSPLMSACQKGLDMIVNTLLMKDAVIDRVGKDGWAAVGLAGKGKFFGIVEEISMYGGDVNIGNGPVSDRVLHIAAENDDVAMTEMLLSRKADPNLSNALGVSVAHIAAAHGNVDILKLLFEHSADLNTRNNKGSSPLFEASCFNHLKAKAFLVEQDCVMYFPHEASVSLLLPLITDTKGRALLLQGVRALGSCLQNETSVPKAVIKECVVYLLKITKDYDNDEEMLIAALEALGSTCAFEDGPHDMSEHGIVTLFVSLLRRKKTAEMFYAICDLLSKLMKVSAKMAIGFGKSQIHRYVAMDLVLFPEEAIVELCFDFFKYLFLSSPSCVCEEAIVAVTTITSQCPFLASVVALSCQTLAAATSGDDPKALILICRHGGIAQCVTAIRNHLNVSEICLSAYQVIINLSFYPSTMTLVVRDGGIGTILAVMKLHHDNSRVQNLGMAALLIISKSGNKEIKVMLNEGLEVHVKQVMAAKITEKKIIDNAVALLESCNIEVDEVHKNRIEEIMSSSEEQEEQQDDDEEEPVSEIITHTSTEH